MTNVSYRSAHNKSNQWNFRNKENAISWKFPMRNNEKKKSTTTPAPWFKFVQTKLSHLVSTHFVVVHWLLPSMSQLNENFLGIFLFTIRKLFIFLWHWMSYNLSVRNNINTNGEKKLAKWKCACKRTAERERKKGETKRA